jgi:hypothetical protein
MVGLSRIEIRESCAQLKPLMHQQTRATGQARLQVLYLFKSRQAKDCGGPQELDNSLSSEIFS